MKTLGLKKHAARGLPGVGMIAPTATSREGSETNMAAEYPIPEEYVKAFRNAVVSYIHLRKGEPEQPLRLDGNDYSIDEIADLISIFDDPMPDDIYETLSSMARPVGDSGLAGKTFKDGARALYLIRLYRDL